MKKLLVVVLTGLLLFSSIGFAEGVSIEDTNRFEFYDGLYIGGESIPAGGYLVQAEGNMTALVRIYENMDLYKDNPYNYIYSEYVGGGVKQQLFININEGYILTVMADTRPAEGAENDEPGHLFMTPRNFKVVVE